MAKQPIDGGGWFDTAKATKWEEGTRWDGNNHVSLATGDKFTHERMYRTAKGTWVLHRWSQWQGSMPSWDRIEPDTAAAWFTRNELDTPPELAAIEAENEV